MEAVTYDDEDDDDMDPTDFMEEGALEIDMEAEPDQDASQEDHIELDQVPETSDDNIVLDTEEEATTEITAEITAEEVSEELQIDEEMGETAEITEMLADVVQELNEQVTGSVEVEEESNHE